MIRTFYFKVILKLKERMSHYSSRCHYFAIEDILASQERITCTFEKKIPFLGVLDPSSESTALEQGTSLELPYWLVSSIIQEDSIAIELPRPFRHSYRDIFTADANVVDLHRLCKYFFEYGKLIANLIERRSSLELCSMLIQTFIDRFRRLSDWAQNSETDHEVTEKFDNYEKSLLQRGKKAQEKLNFWLSEGVGAIRTSELVDGYKKRKLLDKELKC